MKNLIITMGIVVYLVAAMGFQNQWNLMYHRSLELKYAADEAAATACLCIDRQAYGQGYIDFDRGEAERKARAIVCDNLKGSDFRMELTFHTGARPGVSVRLRKGELGARSTYEYVTYEKR